MERVFLEPKTVGRTMSVTTFYFDCKSHLGGKGEPFLKPINFGLLRMPLPCEITTLTPNVSFFSVFVLQLFSFFPFLFFSFFFFLFSFFFSAFFYAFVFPSSFFYYFFIYFSLFFSSSVFLIFCVFSSSFIDFFCISLHRASSELLHRA